MARTRVQTNRQFGDDEEPRLQCVKRTAVWQSLDASFISKERGQCKLSNDEKDGIFPSVFFML